MTSNKKLRKRLRRAERDEVEWMRKVERSTHTTLIAAVVMVPWGVLGIVILILIRRTLPAGIWAGVTGALSVGVLGLSGCAYKAWRMRQNTRESYRDHMAELARFSNELDEAEGTAWRIE